MQLADIQLEHSSKLVLVSSPEGVIQGVNCGVGTVEWPGPLLAGPCSKEGDVML